MASCHRRHRRRLRAVERDQQGKLAIGQPGRPQRRIKTPRQAARRALSMQAQAGIAHQQGGRESHRI
jgi:hypothetical protein